MNIVAGGGGSGVKKKLIKGGGRVDKIGGGVFINS